MTGLDILAFDWADAFGLDDQLSDEERLVRDTAQAYAQEKLLPMLAAGTLPVIVGFGGATADGRPTTLGRGGTEEEPSSNSTPWSAA